MTVRNGPKPASRRNDETMICNVCHQEREELGAWEPKRPGACCRRVARHRTEYFHIPKLFTIGGLRTQTHGVRSVARALVRNLRGTTKYAREHGRLRAVGMLFKYWIDNWYVLDHRKGWVLTPEEYD